MLGVDEVTLNAVERSLRLAGPQGLGARPRPELIGPVLGTVEGTLLDAVRMGFLHSSRARGRVPTSLRAAAEVRFIGHSGENGATLLRFEVPTFGSVASELFQQHHLWDDGPKPEETAFELFGAALHDVAVRCTTAIGSILESCGESGSISACSVAELIGSRCLTPSLTGADRSTPTSC